VPSNFRKILGCHSLYPSTARVKVDVWSILVKFHLHLCHMSSLRGEQHPNRPPPLRVTEMPAAVPRAFCRYKQSDIYWTSMFRTGYGNGKISRANRASRPTRGTVIPGMFASPLFATTVHSRGTLTRLGTEYTISGKSSCLRATHIYTSAHTRDGTEGIMFSGCPSICACVRACGARVKAFSKRLATDFQLTSFCDSCYFNCLFSYTVVISMQVTNTSHMVMPGKSSWSHYYSENNNNTAYDIYVNKTTRKTLTRDRADRFASLLLVSCLK